MTLIEMIKNDIIAALKGKEELRLSVLRMVHAVVHNREIEKRSSGRSPELTDEEVINVIRSEVKKRRDSIQEFKKGGRTDLVEKESTELDILGTYMPEELSDEAIRRVVEDVIKGAGQVTQNDFGRIMGDAMKRLKGQAGGERVSVALKQLLEIK